MVLEQRMKYKPDFVSVSRMWSWVESHISIFDKTTALSFCAKVSSCFFFNFLTCLIVQLMAVHACLWKKWWLFLWLYWIYTTTTVTEHSLFHPFIDTNSEEFWCFGELLVWMYLCVFFFYTNINRKVNMSVFYRLVKFECTHCKVIKTNYEITY